VIFISKKLINIIFPGDEPEVHSKPQRFFSSLFLCALAPLRDFYFKKTHQYYFSGR
jgi:hypothetical protein